MNFYLITNNLLFSNTLNSKKLFSIFPNEFHFLSYSNHFNFNEKSINPSFYLKNFLYSLLSKVSPIFSYFIYSVDKNIRKFSRGKSGKYTFI